MAKVYKSSRRDRLAGADVLIAGLFSAKEKDYEGLVQATAALATARGGRVLGRIVQRRGVSDGGVAAMTRPFSRQTVLTAGKIREIAQRCQADQIGAVVFVNVLTERQRLILERRFGCPVLSRIELEQPET
jgi:50S ribosomal subunit-associated GTPase HflX